MKILLTGVSGFVGKNIAKYLINKGHQIIGVCRREVKDKIGGVKYVQCDLSTPFDLRDKVDAIVHVAGQVGEALTNVYIDNTLISTRNVIDYGERNNVKKIIFMSTIAVYGEVQGVVNEGSSKTNLSNYGLVKLLAEHMIEESEFSQKYVIRLPRVLGEGLDYSFPWIPKLTYSLIFDQKVNYYNASLPYNNMVYVGDVAKFCDVLLSNDDSESTGNVDIIGLGSDDIMTIKEIIDFIYCITQSKSILEEQKSNNANTVHLIDINKAKHMGFVPQTMRQTLEDFANVSVKNLKGEKNV